MSIDHPSAHTLDSNAWSPRISVVVPTRNRPAHVVACVRSILAADGFDELIVVDQSDAPTAEEALASIGDPRLRYLRTDTRGVSHGRNLGIEMSRGDIIAFTDDDCRAASDWVRRLTGIFAADPAAAVVCGRVVVPDQMRSIGWAESFRPRTREWQGRFPPMGEWGITANFSVRRSALARVGRFDPMLGAGAPLRSGAETDLLFRILQAGLKVVNADEVRVEHVGIRSPGAESARLIRGYGNGIAAAFFKHVRLFEAAAAVVYLRFLASTAGRVGRTILRGGRPTGAGFLLALVSGAFASFAYPVDRKRRQYIERL